MNVSIVVICRNEENNIKTCLDSLLNQEGLNDCYEIIVFDDGSLDNTRDIINELSLKNSKLRLINGRGKGIPYGRNQGTKAARYDHVAFIDADCFAPPDWLATLVSAFINNKKEDDRLVAVGGGNIPPLNANRFVKAIGIALDSFPGSFNSPQGRRFSRPKRVNHLACLNVLYEKRQLVKIGYFDESLETGGEDAEMNFRLSGSGAGFQFCPESFVWHQLRSTPAEWFRNMFRYGFTRAEILKRHPRMWHFNFVLPLIFFSAFTLTLLTPVNPIFGLPFLYFPVIFIFSAFQALSKKSLRLVFHVWLVFVVQHFGYALGEVTGLAVPLAKKGNKYTGLLPLRYLIDAVTGRR
jgi:succinoglycan biosynthesis protein ExoA